MNNTATPLERPRALEGRPLLTDEEVALFQKRADHLFQNDFSDFGPSDDVFMAAFENVERYTNPQATRGSSLMLDRVFERRTSLIIDPPDGRIPPLTRSGAARVAERAAARERLAGPEDLPASLRCISWGVPKLRAGNPYDSFYWILQAQDHIIIHTETDIRIVPLGGRPHLPSTIRTWNGDARGSWDGDTLVVDTTNFSSAVNFRGAGEGLHLIERFTRIAENVLRYRITIEDPTTWITPWTLEMPLRTTDARIFEFACHEGNYEVMRGMLRAARP
jgi:hypothetical protein